MKILLSLLILLLSVSTCQKKIEKRLDNIDSVQMFSTDDTLTRKQIDSLFITDTLSFDLTNDWIQSPVIVEDDTQKDFAYKYIYIKNLTDSTGTIYTLYGYQDTLFIINKKVIK